MISRKAANFIIRHLDAIDKAVSKRLMRKRPWFETALTSLLCDLLDGETQDEQNLEYSLEKLNKDLNEIDGLLDISFAIDTHEYNQNVEHYITQSDIGFILNFEDHLLQEESWSAAYLLQAKRLSPFKPEHPIRYNEKSGFNIDTEQMTRIYCLNKILGVNCIKYLLYCPRPSMLDNITEKKLSHLRNQTLENWTQFFDNIFWLEFYQKSELLEDSLAAGIFVNEIENLPTNLGNVHKSIFKICLPFSWFIVQHFFGSKFDEVKNFKCSNYDYRKEEMENTKWESIKWVHDIVSGKTEAIDKLVQKLSNIPEDKKFRFLPKHTISLTIRVGNEGDEILDW
ncbi:MAG: hypothetical protein EAZ77_08045 [Nostocales cyanobacterium]|nr:MAG: hypothetical protein EAZ77_08045 [Nostocales cyanobacterium]